MIMIAARHLDGKWPIHVIGWLALIYAVLVHPEKAWAAGPEFRVATFEADITIPIGHACMGGGVADAKEIMDPLFAKGFVLLGAGEPIVVVALVQQRFLRSLAGRLGGRGGDARRARDAGDRASARRSDL